MRTVSTYPWGNDYFIKNQPAAPEPAATVTKYQSVSPSNSDSAANKKTITETTHIDSHKITEE